MIRRAAALASVLLVAPVLAAAPAQSAPVCKAGYQCDRTYYSDNTHDQVVGGFTLFCDGSVIEWGEFTSFQRTTQAQCPDR